MSVSIGSNLSSSFPVDETIPTKDSTNTTPSDNNNHNHNNNNILTITEAATPSNNTTTHGSIVDSMTSSHALPTPLRSEDGDGVANSLHIDATKLELTPSKPQSQGGPSTVTSPSQTSMTAPVVASAPGASFETSSPPPRSSSPSSSWTVELLAKMPLNLSWPPPDPNTRLLAHIYAEGGPAAVHLPLSSQ